MSALFLKVLHMSVCASWLVLAVLLLRLCLRRAPKWFNVLLWGIVAVRLVFPFSVESPLSLLPRTEAIRPAAIAVQTQPAQISSAAAAGGSAAPAQSWLSILAWVWLAGAAALFLYTMVSTLRLRHRVREAVRLRGNIYQSERIDSPFVLGTIRPRIYLPYRMDSRDRQHVIAHEQAHLRRGDHLWKPLGFLLLTIHWFNPVMWLSYVLLCRDIELACDRLVQRQPPQNCGLPPRLRRDRSKGACQICYELQKTNLLDHSGGHHRLHRPRGLLPDRPGGLQDRAAV